MHYLDAIVKSKNKVATRKTKDGRITRQRVDSAEIQDRHGVFRKALPEEVQGFTDWEPEEE